MATTPRGAGPSPARSSAVDGLRGAAALALLTVHVAMFSGLLGTRAFGVERPPSNWWGAFVVSGFPSFIGVFFVLPALYLYLPLARAVIAGRPRPSGQRRGFVKRLLRLLPAYYVMVLIVLFTLHRDTIDGPWYVLRPLLLLQIYLPTPFAPSLINGLEITWTVPTMVQWYAVLPLIAWAVHRFAARGATPRARARRLMAPVPLLIALGVGWLFVVKGNGWDNRIVFWWPQGFATAIGIGMALAIMLALAQVAPEATPRVLRLGASRPGLFWLGAAAAYLVNCARPFSVIGMDALYSTAGLLVTYLLVAVFGFCAVVPLIAPGGSGGPRIVTGVLRWGPLVHVGRVSYGIYLWHFAVMYFYLQPDAVLHGGVRPLREFWGGAGFWELQLVTVAGSVLIATISYHLVEQPVARWGEALLDRTGSRRTRRDRTEHGPRPADTRGSTVDAALADRDAVRANLLELEAGRGARILSADDLSGATLVRRRAVQADLAALWEVFTAWSDVVDRACAAPASAGALLDDASVLLQGPRPPLGVRSITDTGTTRLTGAQAVARMDALFRQVAPVVSAVEQVLDTVGPRLDDVEARLRGPAPLRVEEARAQLHDLRRLLATDPLAFWAGDAPDLTAVDRLSRQVATPGGGTDRLAG